MQKETIDEENTKKVDHIKTEIDEDVSDHTGLEKSLWNDKKLEHGGFQYPCDQCEFAAINILHLKKHKECKHDKVRYSCDQCDYSATRKSYLKIHKESVHEGMKHSCDRCDYVASTVLYLTRHMKRKHSDIGTPCLSLSEEIFQVNH